MLEFPNSFFKPEEREGFYISETMKRYWACCMEILNQIAIVCNRHNIEFYADWGTLLGTIRHNGFIPWDDDIDIAVKRPDYERLLNYLKEELPEDYMLSSPYHREEHRQFFTGVSNGKVMDLSKEHVERYYGCPFVAVIDIFPLDYIPRDEEQAEMLKNLFVIIWDAVEKIKNEASQEEIEEAVSTVEDLLNVKIQRGEFMRSQLWKVANQLVKSYTEEESDCLVEWLNYTNCGKLYPKEWYDDSVLVQFENVMLPVPKEYDKILTNMYGNWRIPVKGSAAHDYPCYKDQLQFMRELVKKNKENK